MSEYYNNPLADELKSKIDKDYIFSMHKLSSAKGITINHKDIVRMDDISVMEKSKRPNALKDMFVELNSKKDK